MAWLTVNYPEAVRAEWLTPNEGESVVPTLVTSTPVAGIHLADMSPVSDPCSSSTSSPVADSVSTADSGTPVSTADSGTPVSTADSGTPVSTADSGTPVSTADSGTPVSTADSGTPVSTLAKYLVPLPIPVPSTPKTVKARVLTSTECIALFEEKEKKKKLEAEKKAVWKLEREWKKKEKIKEQKRKAEERRSKAEERKCLAEEKRRKKPKGKQVLKGKENRSPDGISTVSTTNCKIVQASQEVTDPTSDITPGAGESSRPKRARISVAAFIDSNTCCTCFRHYEVLAGSGSSVSVEGGCMRTVLWDVLMVPLDLKYALCASVFIFLKW